MQLAPLKMPHCGTAAGPGTDILGNNVLAPNLLRSPALVQDPSRSVA